jgi:hypothetical protein
MRKIPPAIVFSLSVLFTVAQSRVAIVNLMDSVLLHENVGITVFANSTGEFDCQFNPKEYVDHEMERFLSGKFSPIFVLIEDSPVEIADEKPADEIYEDIYPEKINYKAWVKEHRNEYNYVVFIENRPWTDPLLNIQLQSNGVFTSGNIIKHWAKVYSTVYITAYSTKTLKTLYFDKSNWYYTRTIKDYKFPEENAKIDPEMVQVIIDHLKGLIDSRIEHFMVGTGLLSQDEFHKVKMQ